MSKGLGFTMKSKAQPTGKKNIPTVIPKNIRDDPDFRFGVPAYLPGNQRIDEVINYDYLREFLSKNVTAKAQHTLI